MNQADQSSLRVELLEGRLVPVTSAVLTNGFLQVTGDAGVNQINVFIDATQTLRVQETGVDILTAAANQVSCISVESLDGNDVINFGGLFLGNVRVDAGGGDDIVFGGAGRSRLDGGAGSDVIVGGSGYDTILGGEGNDVIGAAAGKDVAQAGAGNDNVQMGAGRDAADGGAGNDLITGDGDNDRILGGADNDTLQGNLGNDSLRGDAGIDQLSGDGGVNILAGDPGVDLNIDTGLIFAAPPNPAAVVANVESTEVLLAAEVDALLNRASAVTPSQDAIFAIVDRNGRILGVRAEAQVAAELFANPANSLVFAVDGAVAKARTAAFFANNGAPLTSRSIQFISQSTILQREVNANPNVDQDPNSTIRGPGFVAPIGVGGHFPPVNFTPSANLFDIEHTNRDSVRHPGPDGIKGTGDDVLFANRFNIDAFNTGKQLFAPESFGLVSGLNLNAQARGVATLPGGIPLYKNGQLVGGIGVFFPGRTGFASEENSSLSADFNPNRPDRSLEAEWIAFATAGGSRTAGQPVGTVGGVAPVAGFDLPFGRIDVDGIKVPLFGPLVTGAEGLVAFGTGLGQGAPSNNAGLAFASQDGRVVDNGWIVGPKAGGNLTAADVEQIIRNGVDEANKTRAAIRLRPPDLQPGQSTAMVLAVSDTDGNVLGLFRMPDATVFSIDVAVAKARNVSYYADAAQVNPADLIDLGRDGVPDLNPGVAFTNRTFRYSALPFFPSGIPGQPGPFSILRDGQADTTTGLNNTAPLPVSAFTSVAGRDAFFPGSNFRDPQAAAGKTNGIVFFPGSSALYKDTNGDGVAELVGGFGVSGDGVDQDDVVTFAGVQGFAAPSNLRADQFFVGGIRLPYTKFSRSPEERVVQF